MKSRMFKIKAVNRPEFWPGQQVAVKLKKSSKYKVALSTIEYVVWDKQEDCWKYALNGWMGERKAEDLMRIHLQYSK